MSQWDAIVIGGGFAGLAAATSLTQEGARVLVLEARPALGGRAATFRDPQTGERIDNGQHVLVGCYYETLRFLRRIATDHLLHHPSALKVSMIDSFGARTTLALPPLPAPLHLLAGVLAWDALTWRERASILRIGPALKAGAATNGVGLTIREWLRQHGQSPRLCELLWEPLALAALNQPIDRAQVAPFLAVLSRMFSADAGGSALLLPAVFLDAFYAEPAREYLHARGSEVRTNSPARLVVANSQVRGAQVRGILESTQTVIATVPWFAFRDLFETPPESLAKLVADADALESSPIVTVNVWLDRAVLSDIFIGLPGRTFQWLFDKGQIIAADVTHLSLVSSGADEILLRDNEALVATALDEVRQALPEARSAVVRRTSVVRERRATFSLAANMPPRPSTTTAVKGLLLAGDWIETGLPATIESAVVSGHRAATNLNS